MLKRIYKKLYINFFFDAQEIDRKEKEKFKLIGNKESEALKKLDKILLEFRGSKFNYEKDSIHWLLWSVISLNKNVNRILEIGTFDGVGTHILARLFPESEVVSIDLPENDPLLRAFYKRDTEEGYKNYLNKQKKNTNLTNINLIKMNSFFLLSQIDGKFDLIWVDGGHLYPDIAWDLSNAWHLLSNGGVLMCDDVIPSKKKYKNDYASTESFEVIEYLKERTNIKPALFLKRRDRNQYPFVLRRKFVAYIEKLV